MEWLFPILALVAGSLLAVLAGVTGWQAFRMVNHGARRTASVVGYEECEGCFLPVVEFLDEAGISRRMTCQSGQGNQPYPMGSRVEVVWDRSNPATVSIRSFGSLWFVPIVTGVLAMGFLAGAWLSVP